MTARRGDIIEPVNPKPLIGIFVLLATVTSIPYGYGFLRAPAGFRYTGLHSINQGDLYSYLALVEQAREGRVLLRNLHTPEAHPAFMIRPLFTLTGWLARLFHVSDLVAFHGMRIASILLFLLCAGWLAREAFEQAWQRITFLAMLVSASGIGWLLLLVFHNNRSADLWMPEIIPFMSMAESPHFVVSTALMIVAAVAYPKLLFSGNRRWLLFTGISLLLLSFVHPFDLATLVPVIVLFTVIFLLLEKNAAGKKTVSSLVLVLLFVSPGAVYYGLASHFVPVFSAWKGQVSTPSPPVLSYLTGLGIPLLFALPAFGIRLCKKALGLWKPPLTSIMALWCIVAFALSYAPIQSSRRVMEGIFVPVCYFAVLFLAFLRERLFLNKGRAFYSLVLILLLFSSVSNIHLLFRDIRALKEGKGFYYLPESFFEAADWLKKNADENSIILSHPALSYFIPALTGKAAFSGHREMTVDAEEKNRSSLSALQDPGLALAIMKQYGIDYLLLPVSKGHGTPYDKKANGLGLVFENRLFRIYRLEKDSS
jgi:hypothetical protein